MMGKGRKEREGEGGRGGEGRGDIPYIYKLSLCLLGMVSIYNNRCDAV